VYLRETEPIIQAFRDRGILLEVDGIGAVDEVAGRVAEALDAVGIAPTDIRA
jgi:adenylate kinase